jgi:hypothetical protein
MDRIPHKTREQSHSDQKPRWNSDTRYDALRSSRSDQGSSYEQNKRTERLLDGRRQVYHDRIRFAESTVRDMQSKFHQSEWELGTRKTAFASLKEVYAERASIVSGLEKVSDLYQKFPQLSSEIGQLTDAFRKVFPPSKTFSTQHDSSLDRMVRDSIPQNFHHSSIFQKEVMERVNALHFIPVDEIPHGLNKLKRQHQQNLASLGNRIKYLENERDSLMSRMVHDYNETIRTLKVSAAGLDRINKSAHEIDGPYEITMGRGPNKYYTGETSSAPLFQEIPIQTGQKVTDQNIDQIRQHLMRMDRALQLRVADSVH